MDMRYKWKKLSNWECVACHKAVETEPERKPTQRAFVASWGAGRGTRSEIYCEQCALEKFQLRLRADMYRRIVTQMYDLAVARQYSGQEVPVVWDEMVGTEEMRRMAMRIVKQQALSLDYLGREWEQRVRTMSREYRLDVAVGDKRRTYRHKLILKPRKRKVLEQMLETHRRLYNTCLEQRKTAYKERGEFVSLQAQRDWLTKERPNNEWYLRCNRNSLDATLTRLDRAYQAYFAGRSERPKFKARDRFNSFEFSRDGNGYRAPEYEEGTRKTYLYVQHIGYVKMWMDRPFEGVPKTLEIVRENGSWYACFSCLVKNHEVVRRWEPAIGIDVGLESFLTTDQGQHVKNPRFYAHDLREYRRRSRALSRKMWIKRSERKLPYVCCGCGQTIPGGNVAYRATWQDKSKSKEEAKKNRCKRCPKRKECDRGTGEIYCEACARSKFKSYFRSGSGSNRLRAKRSLRKQAQQIHRRRMHFLHEVANEIADHNGFVAIEALQIKNMTKKQKKKKKKPETNVAKPTKTRGRQRQRSLAINDASWGRFRTLLQYKVEERGGMLVAVDPQNTTQMCSGCGEIVPKTERDRQHECPHCGLSLHRDHNAAKNILARGFLTLTPDRACKKKSAV